MKFRTDTGIIMTGISANRMKLVDELAIKYNSPNLFQMMENAGRTLAKFIIDLAGSQWKERKILIISGKGGNGGGGICAARHLNNRDSHVSLCLATASELNGVPKEQLDIYLKGNGKVISSEVVFGSDFDIIVDAIIGYGLKSEIKEETLALTDYVNNSTAQVISLDIPTGINAKTGEAPGASIKPNATLTLAYPKSGLRKHSCGKLFLCDIGIPPSIFYEADIDYSNPFDDRWIIPITELQ